MINTVKDYLSSLKELSGKGTSEFILIRIKNETDIIDCSESLEHLLSGLNLSRDELVLLISKTHPGILQEYAQEGCGVMFVDPATISEVMFKVEYIIVYSLLKEYVSIVFMKKRLQHIGSADPFNALMKYSKSLFFIYNPDTRKISYISPSVKKILGYTEEQLLNITFDDLVNLIYPDDRKKIKKFASSIYNNKIPVTPSSFEVNIKDSQGVYHVMQLRVLTGKPESGITDVFCSAQDVTEIRKAEKTLISTNKRLKKAESDLKIANEELAQLNIELEKHNEELEKTYKYLLNSEEMFRQFAENINDVFWLRNAKEFLYINNQFDKIWGRSKEEVFENPNKLTEWIHPDDLLNVEPWVNLESLVRGTPFVEQYRIIRPDGKIRWIGSRSFPVLNKEGKTYRLVGIATDITEQKEFEETLRIAKEKAQESDMLKSTFLANISHEIRTPMNGIVGFAELLSRDDIDSEVRRNYVSIMKKSSDQLVCIIDDIIDFAKLESNQIRIIDQPFDLNKMLEELNIFYENQLQKKEKSSVTLLYESTAGYKKNRIISDEHRIRQVFTYLLDNAIKYTSEGYVKYGYRIADEKIEFYVQDSGIGIPADKHEHIFERFRQIDEGQTRKYGGTGLGLSIAKGLVNLLGGQIWLTSESGKGSTFFFTVPYRIEHAAEPDSISVSDEAFKYKWKNKLILVAEDDELNFEYIKVLIEPTEAKLIRAKDGSQVIKICSNLNFDLILMDIRLPVLNGIQTTQQLREMGVLTPIIAQTAFAMDDDEKRCLSAGCNRYIAKPISKEKLYTLIEELI